MADGLTSTTINCRAKRWSIPNTAATAKKRMAQTQSLCHSSASLGTLLQTTCTSIKVINSLHAIRMARSLLFTDRLYAHLIHRRVILSRLFLSRTESLLARGKYSPTDLLNRIPFTSLPTPKRAQWVLPWVPMGRCTSAKA